MGTRSMWRRGVVSAGVVVGLVAATAASVVPSAGATRTVRGFDGSTVTVAGMGIKQQLPGAEWGARARIQRFNDTNEVKGVQINYTELADDKQDVAIALSEARRLVTQTGVFAIVGDVSNNNPADYFAQQHVPVFGGGFDQVYCSPKPNPATWGFGYAGCRNNPAPTFVGDIGSLPYKYVSAKSGKKHPTAATFSQDNDTGRSVVHNVDTFLSGAGFDVVFAEAMIPTTPVGDYSPYVQKLLTADNGKPPDFIWCSLSTECISVFAALKEAGFTGTYNHSLYSEVLVGVLQGTIATIAFNNLSTPGVPALDQMKADVAAVKPTQKIDTGVVYGYFSTDMFITALKKAAKQGKAAITPENVRKIASTMTWSLKDLAGPTRYPDATVTAAPVCETVMVSTGTEWQTVEKFACSAKKFKVKG